MFVVYILNIKTHLHEIKTTKNCQEQIALLLNRKSFIYYIMGQRKTCLNYNFVYMVISSRCAYEFQLHISKL